jgi:hypothetical protein
VAGLSRKYGGVRVHVGHHRMLGRYWMPSSILSPDGLMYQDGTEVDPVTLYLAHSGLEQECYLVAVTGLTILVSVLVYKMKRLHRMQVDAFKRELQRLRDMRANGRS